MTISDISCSTTKSPKLSPGLTQRDRLQWAPTFTGMSVPEHHLGVGPKAFHVVDGGRSTDAAHALPGGGRSETRDRRSRSERVLLAPVLGLGHILVRVYPVPGALWRRVVQRPGHWGGAMAGADEGAGVVGVGRTAALAGCGELVVASGHRAVAVVRGVHHDGIGVFLGQGLLADAQER